MTWRARSDGSIYSGPYCVMAPASARADASGPGPCTVAEDVAQVHNLEVEELRECLAIAQAEVARLRALLNEAGALGVPAVERDPLEEVFRAGRRLHLRFASGNQVAFSVGGNENPQKVAEEIRSAMRSQASIRRAP